MTEQVESLPLPDDPVLAAWASALNDVGYWAHVLDAKWRWVFTTDDLRLSMGDTGTSTILPIGSHYFGPEATRFLVVALGGPWAVREYRRVFFSDLGPYVLASTPGGRDEVRQMVNPNSQTSLTTYNPMRCRSRGQGEPLGRPPEPTSRARQCGFGSTTIAGISWAFACSSSPLRAYRTSRKPPQLQTWRFSNGCGSWSTPIDDPRRF